MTLLLTGATGFVGRNLLLRVLAEKKYEKIYVTVRSLEKLRAQFLGDGFDAIPTNVIPVVGSAHEWKIPASVGFDHVIHCAGVVFGRDRREYFGVHVDGTLKLLREIGNPERVLILSSQAASGPCPPGHECKSEADVDAPVTWYGESKLEMEKRVVAEFPNMNLLILRPPMVLGARDQATLPLFKMAKKPVHLKPGMRAKYYSFISVDDLVGAMLAALDGQIDWVGLERRHFYVASPEVFSDSDLIAGAASAVDSRGVLLRVPQPLLKMVSHVVDRVPAWRRGVPSLTLDRVKEIFPDRWVVSAEGFQTRFKWRAKDSLQSALRSTVQWYQKTGQL